MTPQLQLVLRQALVDEGREWFGREMSLVTGLAEGTVYQMLARLEARGFVASRLEDRGERAPAPGSPRRYFRLTGRGVELARSAAAAAGGGGVDRTAPVPWPEPGSVDREDPNGVLEAVS
ncbi:PadR family transcriptional regulator [Actinomadura sp. GTD37]|uniref:PadR family transcriptional regulator n=1 Tax=Actinomadura sp. GTD37 TaxID=1778030 RepID=UPI0035C1CE98